MLEFLLFMLFSALETSALFYLAFKIFKIDLYSKEIIFASMIMGFLSYSIRHNYGLPEVDFFLQYMLAFCFVWLLFRIHVFYAVIMTGFAYQTFMVIQTLLYLMLNATGMYELQFPIISTGIYLLQLLSAATAILIGSYIGKKRKGFDFIPDKPDGKIIVGTRDKILFALTVPSIVVNMLNLYFIKHLYPFFYLIPIFYAVILLGYLYLSNKKDRGDE